MHVRLLRFTLHNLAKLAVHRIVRREVQEMIAFDARVPFTDDRYPDQVLIIGPSAGGRLLTIARQRKYTATAIPAGGEPVS